jgi:hypothetical protein
MFNDGESLCMSVGLQRSAEMDFSTLQNSKIRTMAQRSLEFKTLVCFFRSQLRKQAEA